MSIRGLQPSIGEGCYIAPSANIIGDVRIGSQCSIWFNAVLRGDVSRIELGNRVNVQDCACVHVAEGENGKVVIEDDVSVGHNATVHACTVRRGALIGMGATVLDGAEVGEGAIVAAGAVVSQGTKIGAHEIWAGIPAKYIKQARPGQAEEFGKHYVVYTEWYRNNA